MIQFSIDDSRDLLHIRGARDITYEDVKKLFQEILREPKIFGSHLRCLSDFSDIRCNLSHREIRKLQRIFSIKSRDFHIRHAHVTTAEDELKASVFFAILGEDRDDIHTCVFQKKPLAESWLGYDQSDNIHTILQDGLWN